MLVPTRALASNAAPVMGESNQYVTFRCGPAGYGVPIMAVREIRSWQPTTPVPGRGPASRGLLNLRGMVIEVLDLGVMLGRGPAANGHGQVVLVLSHKEKHLGLAGDAVSDIIQAEPGDLMPLPLRTPSLTGASLTAMVDHETGLIGVLDLDSLFGALL